MAKKLHDTYGFSYDNLKVLLGGWNTWKENSTKDPSGYPIETAPGTTPGTGSNGQTQVGNGIVILTPGSAPPASGVPQPTPKP